VLEAIEVHGVRKYFEVWERYRDDDRLALALRDVLEDEFKHEDATVGGGSDRRINPERIRNIFLGTERRARRDRRRGERVLRRHSATR
jgi:hypothetical protein